jgi:hypothetical protein
MLVAQFAFPMHRHLHAAYSKDSDERRRSDPERDSRLSHLWKVAWYGFLMLVAASLSIIIAILLLSLAVASILPIPRIDRAVQWIVVKLSAFLGDSYVLVRCPVEYAAMRARVQRDLTWLQTKCDRIVVVAHSQGAAIAHQVLKKAGSGDKDDLRAFITIGQGITKLQVLRHLELDPAARRLALLSRTCVILGLGAAGLPAFALLLSRWVTWPLIQTLVHLPAWLTLALVVVGFLVVVLGVVLAVKAVDEKIRDELPLPGAGEDFSWIDYFASADPVSSGPIGTEDAHRPSICVEVHNQASVLTDHTAYLRNENQFLPRLINDLVAVAYGGEKDYDPAIHLVSTARLHAAHRRRRHLVKWLIAGRWAALAVGIWFWIRNLEEVFGIRLNRHMPEAILQANLDEAVARLTPAVLAMGGVYIAIVILWRAVVSLQTKRFFDHEDQETQAPGNRATPAARTPGPARRRGLEAQPADLDVARVTTGVD